MLNRIFACTVVLASVLLSCAAHAGNIFSDAMTILDRISTNTLNSSQIFPEASIEPQGSEASIELQENVSKPDSSSVVQPIKRELSLSPYQKQVTKEFKNNLKWMYDQNMTYLQLASGSPEKKAIDFVADKVASSVAQCDGRYFAQNIQGSSLVASTIKAGNVYEITDPSYGGRTRYTKLTKANMLNGEEYKGTIYLNIYNTAIRDTDSTRWQDKSSLSREYSLEIVNGSFVDGTPFSENHLQNLEQYQPLQCSDIKL